MLGVLYLQKLLPEQYSHTVCSYETIGDNSFKAAIKLKLSSEEEAKRWLEDFQCSSGFIWRTSKTYPNVGRYNKYRVSITHTTIRLPLELHHITFPLTPNEDEDRLRINM